MRSGGVNINIGRLWYTSVNGAYWSMSTTSKPDNGVAIPSAYDFDFTAASTYSSYNNYRRYGFPLRCHRKKVELIPPEQVQLTFISIKFTKIQSIKPILLDTLPGEHPILHLDQNMEIDYFFQKINTLTPPARH